MKTLFVVILLFLCCQFPFTPDKVTAAGNTIEGYMIFTAHPDTTIRFYRNCVNTEDMFGSLMVLKTRGMQCDSIFTFYWQIEFTGDSLDFLSDPEPYNQFAYYPPNDIGGCDEMLLYGTAPTKTVSNGTSLVQSGYMIFKAKADSTVEYCYTTTTIEEMNLAIQQLKAQAVPCSTIIWWWWEVTATEGFLADDEPPYPNISDQFLPVTESMVVDCDSMVITSPF